jgi:hypothetical protein
MSVTALSSVDVGASSLERFAAVLHSEQLQELRAAVKA